MSQPSAEVAQQAALTKRRAEAVKLKLAGASYQQIADSDLYPAGTHKSTVFRDVVAALREAQTEMARDVELLRTEDLLRLERLLLANWQQAMGGSTRHTETCLRIISARGDLLGTKAPQRHVWESETEVDRAIRDLEQQLGVGGGSPATPG